MNTDKRRWDVDQEHPEYVAKKATWRMYRDLYVGGERFKENAGTYLTQRQREPGDVYAERLSRACYENYIGSIVDWYAATLFRREPNLTFLGPNEPARRYFSSLVQDADLKGTALSDFFRNQFLEGLVTGASWVLVDFPRVDGMAMTRAEEEAWGTSRAYLVPYRSEDVINWGYDDDGVLEWAVVRTSSVKKGNIEDADWRTETVWRVYEREKFRVFRRERLDGAIVQESEGLHGLAKQRQVPLFKLNLPEGQWLLNRAGSLQLEHFNKSNALSWALTMGLFAMPVVYSEREFSQMVGESYYIQLGPEDKFGWTEPEGKVYQIAADNLVRLQEEIYRVCYLTQVGGAMGSGAAQSALAKQRDFAVTVEVLRAFGDAMKEQIRKVLLAIEGARQDGLDVSVMGLDEFDIADFGTELEDGKALLELGFVSPTLKKEVFKKLALKYLCDARQDVKDRVVGEIEAA
jgi:hypothetical protein